MQLEKTKVNSRSRIIPGGWLCAAESPRTPWLFTPYPTAFAVALVHPSEGTGAAGPRLSLFTWVLQAGVQRGEWVLW